MIIFPSRVVVELVLATGILFDYNTEEGSRESSMLLIVILRIFLLHVIPKTCKLIQSPESLELELVSFGVSERLVRIQENENALMSTN